MANFFQNPVIPRVTNPEPAGFNLIRQMLMNQMFQRNANPYGMNPGGQTGGNPLFPSGGRGAFDPYGGMNTGAFSPGTNPGMGGGGFKGKIPGGGGGSTGNNFMQMLQNFLKQYQGGGGAGRGNVPFRGGGETPPSGGVESRGVGIGTRTPTPGTGGIEPWTGGDVSDDTSGGMQIAPSPMMDTEPRGGVTRASFDAMPDEFGIPRVRPPRPSPMPGGFGSGGPGTPMGGGFGTGGPGTPTGGGFGFGGPGTPTGGMASETPPAMDTNPMTPGGAAPSYDGRQDVSKMMHAHQKMMTSVLPMLLQAPRVAAAAPSTTAGGPLPGYDGAMLTRPGGGYAPYDGMAPENAPSWTPLSERSGGTGLNLAESNTPNSLPASRDVPPLPRPGYDGNDDAAYGGFRHVRAPNVAPRPSMGVRPPMNAAAALQRILAGQSGANRRGGIQQSRAGSKASAFDGSMEQPRGPAPSYDGSGSNASTIPITGDPAGSPPTGYDTGGSASPYPTGAQTGGQAMYPWLMPYTGQRTAAMTPYEMQGLNSMSDFMGGGMGTGAARDYLNDLLSGKYVGSDNPYMADFQKGAQTLKDSEDALARQRIGSSMAAGGNALSGARMASEQAYQNTSDAQFQKMLADMKMQNLARERALQQGGVGLQEGLGQEIMGGYGQLMNAGSVPRNIQQGDFNSQYQDWLRQIGSMSQQDQFQQNLATQMLHTSPGAYQPGYGTSAAEGIAALLAGSGAAGGIGDLLKKLFSGGGSGGSKGGGGGGTGSAPGKDSAGRSPGQNGYDPWSDPGSGYMANGPAYTDQNGQQWIQDPDTGAYVPQDTGYNDQTFQDWLSGGGTDQYGPYTEGFNFGDYGGQNGPWLPGEDPWAGTGGSNDMGWDWGAGSGGDWMTGGYDDYSNYGDYSGDTSGWG